MPNHANFKYQYSVFIGRFQPVHNGHLFVFKKALALSKNLILLVGSAGGPRSLRNPFSYEERVEMIKQSLPQDLSERIIFKPLKDFMYNDDAWVDNIYKTIDSVTSNQKNIALIGHDKDESTYYLKLFPNWHYEEIENLAGINATKQRNLFLSNQVNEISLDTMPQPAINWLMQFSQSSDFLGLSKHYQNVNAIKQQLSQIDVDITLSEIILFIKKDDKILAIKNTENPNQPLYALPHQRPDKDLTLHQFALNKASELLGLSTQQLNQKIPHPIIFDNPKRSPITKVIAHCYMIDLSDFDDVNLSVATNAFWFNLDELNRQNSYQDHYFIVQKLIKNSN